MTISNDAKVQSSSPTPPSVSQKNQKKPTMTAPSSNKHYELLTIILAIFTFIALGCAIYAINTNKQLHQVAAQQVHDLHNQINMLKQQQIDTVTQLTTTTQDFNKLQNKLHNQLNAVDKSLQSALQQRLYQSNDWLLLKARYYLELAQINMHWSDNLLATTALLQQADAILATIHNQQLFNIRQAIAKEIAELQAIPRLDITGLLSQLDAALDAITSLSLKLTMTEKKNDIKENDQAASIWQKGLKNSITLLQSLVVIRRHNEDVVPILSPAYESMLREGIRLNLQEAQWAILQNNDLIYQFSLKQAIQNIKRSFAPDTPGTNALLKQLQTLQTTHLIQQKPTLEQSLLLLNKLIESKGPQTNDKKPTDAGVNP